MTREELSLEALEVSKNSKTVVLEWSTGSGKSKMAIDIINKYTLREPRVLLLVAQSTHKNNWKAELSKWKAKFQPTIECYASLKKYAGQTFDFIIADECQHFSEARREIFDTITVNKNLLCLSATVPNLVKSWLKYKHGAQFVVLKASTAIESNILPDPVIYKIPLQFDNIPTETIITNPAKKGFKKQIKVCKYSRQNYFRCKADKNVEWHLQCTKKEYYDNLTSLIEWYKRKHRDMPMLRASSQRLNWLAHQKNAVVYTILNQLRDIRTVTFCTDIAQSEILGKNCIHSKNKLSQRTLDRFNAESINHITACHILDEGLNLVNCRVGIFANLNASDIMFIQRTGRLLRHKKPVIIIPYFTNTRDEELINKHLEGYNPNLIKTITNYKQIKL